MKYSVSDIDRMRRAISTLPDGSLIDVEDRLRTYMLGEVTPEELESENSKRWAEQDPYKRAVEDVRRQNSISYPQRAYPFRP